MSRVCSSCLSLAELAALQARQAGKLKSVQNLVQTSTKVGSRPLASGSGGDADFKWGYDPKTNGPAVWPKYFPSGAGKRQSPINIPAIGENAPVYDSSLSKPLRFSYDSGSARKLVNTPHTFQVVFDGDAENTISGGPLENPYHLVQMHAHWHTDNSAGSEHTIEGKPYCGELHMVHVNKAKYGNLVEALAHPDGVAVAGMLWKTGKRNEQYDKIIGKFGLIPKLGDETDFESRLNLYDLLPKDTERYWTYPGSLTTPPLTEAVTWILFSEVVEISEWQMAALRSLHPINWRPVQPLNDRKIRKTFTD